MTPMGEGAPLRYPWRRHYYSTACIHERHLECRRTCKFCDRLCLCECHAWNANASTNPMQLAAKDIPTLHAKKPPPKSTHTEA